MSDKVIVKSPLATLEWLYIRKPDTAFDSVGHYKVDLLLTPEEAEEFAKRVSKVGKLKTTKADDKVRIRTKQKAVISWEKDGEKHEQDMAPKLFYMVDGKPTPYPEDSPQPYSGSTGRVEMEAYPYKGFGGGVSLRVRSILFHDIVTGGNTGDSAWGDDEGVSSEEEGAW